ncbi:MAG: hypothetical protein OXN15_09770 [Chloroflexota bacterium]|nr:hypothetical protein [Chloroflexota bacterium]MDE2901287.1 hypothetical protein [Chloroflexota bacterium]MDE2969495.1 hypothetical protein [Chloroflexota bacterium]
MDLNHPLPIHDFSPDTLISLVERIDSSSGFQHFIFREAELDDLWRQVERALVHAQSDADASRDVDRLRTLLECVEAAHDLVSESKKEEAMAQLQAGIRAQA